MTVAQRTAERKVTAQGRAGGMIIALAGTMSAVDKVCGACHKPITEEEQWFRLREDYGHLACAERFMRQLSEKRREGSDTTPGKLGPDTTG